MGFQLMEAIPDPEENPGRLCDRAGLMRRLIGHVDIESLNGLDDEDLVDRLSYDRRAEDDIPYDTDQIAALGCGWYYIYDHDDL